MFSAYTSRQLSATADHRAFPPRW